MTPIPTNAVTHPAAPPVRHVLESALYVSDLGRARAFYEDVLGLPVLLDQDRLVALDAGAATVLLLFQRGASTGGGSGLPAHDGRGRLHLALAVDPGDLDAWRARLAARNVALEHEERWPRGGSSLYFRDPDDHLVELATPGLWPTR